MDGKCWEMFLTVTDKQEGEDYNEPHGSDFESEQ